MTNRGNEPVFLRIDDHQINSDKACNKEDGGHDKKANEILKNPEDTSPQQRQSIFYRWWDKIFMILCQIALFVDPLYCYIPRIVDSPFHLPWLYGYQVDYGLYISFLILRTIIDLFYVLDMFIFTRRTLIKLNATTLWEFWSCTEIKKTIVHWRRFNLITVTAIYKFSLIIFRIFIALPVPQVIVVVTRDVGPTTPLLIFYPVQYSIRAYRSYKLIKQNRLNIETEMGRWLKATLDFIPFVVAAHLCGALWYYLAIEREFHCLAKYCDEFRFSAFYSDYTERRTPKPLPPGLSINSYLFRCNETTVKACGAESTLFDLGIYSYALRTEMTRAGFHPRKILLCFWWGLRNLSSFGQDLKSSSNMMESTLSILVSISGVALFLVYLDARVQGAQKRAEQLKLTRKMRMMSPEIDLWLSRKGLPKDMNKQIKERLRQQLEQNRDVDLKNFIAVLAQQQRDIMYHLMYPLRLKSLKKMPTLVEIDERVLKAICRKLEPVIFPKNSQIIHKGEQFWNVLFIVEGTVWSYTDTYNVVPSRSSDVKYLKKGDFYGEELVSWAFSFGPFSDLPVSSRTVRSKTKVEALAISAYELQDIVFEFHIYFSRRLPQMERSRLENLAASYIQEAWHRSRNRSQLN